MGGMWRWTGPNFRPSRTASGTSPTANSASRYSDPDALWGHRSAVSTRKGGGYYGYKLHAAVCATTGLALAWQVATAKRQEITQVVPLLDKLAANSFSPETCSLDKGYDQPIVYMELESRGIHPAIPLRQTPDVAGSPEAVGQSLFVVEAEKVMIDAAASWSAEPDSDVRVGSPVVVLNIS
jgi:hypothetical protein